MTTWYIREPSGEINDDYPFDNSFKKNFKAKKVFTITLSQDDGMNPEVIGPKLSQILSALGEKIKNYHDQRYTLEFERDKKTYDKYTDFSDALLDEANNIETPWYWDGTRGLIESREVSLLVQPETDGMDIAIYIAGDDAKGLSSKLQEELVDKG